ncbi:unnamed protein product [Ilex paraguariensis]|uniref:Large ribosomal subunit protein bL21m n=1 Tax=Ilex paraguariensis TaxID=185542 RepID=A0ABC8S5U4_9AQUA
MAHRRCLQTLSRHPPFLLSSNPCLHSLKTLNPHHPQPLNLNSTNYPQILATKFHHIFTNPRSNFNTQFPNLSKSFCSGKNNESDDDESEDAESGDEVDDDENVSTSKSLEEREIEAAGIGYKVIGRLEKSDQVFKPYEPVFAVVQIGSHQFKVSNGDSIFTERLKYCEVNDKTIIGRPMLSDATVHAVVEEHALDAKVLIFKKKRRKNYRRTKGHRQELTKLRITDIQGIEKPENAESGKTVMASVKKVERVAVAV